VCAETDPEVFFPEKGQPNDDAKRICGGCEARAECLEFAIETVQEFGVWGGWSENERRAYRRRMRAVA
jgi:WhiB family redox-sensing transcriptional regulator